MIYILRFLKILKNVKNVLPKPAETGTQIDV